MLMIRCKDHRTALAVAAAGFWGFDVSDHRIPVLYRVDALPAVEGRWLPGVGGSGASSSAFLPGDRNPARVVAALPARGRLFVRVTDMDGGEHDMAFALDGLDAVRERVGAACKWTPAAKAAAR
jgi:hypothetical protein